VPPPRRRLLLVAVEHLVDRGGSRGSGTSPASPTGEPASHTSPSWDAACRNDPPSVSVADVATTVVSPNSRLPSAPPTRSGDTRSRVVAPSAVA
jgi:hypothetical protein